MVAVLKDLGYHVKIYDEVGTCTCTAYLFHAMIPNKSKHSSHVLIVFFPFLFYHITLTGNQGG